MEELTQGNMGKAQNRKTPNHPGSHHIHSVSTDDEKEKRQRKSQEQTIAEIKHHAQDDNKSTLAYIIQRSWTNRQIEPRSNLPSPILKQ